METRSSKRAAAPPTEKRNGSPTTSFPEASGPYTAVLSVTVASPFVQRRIAVTPVAAPVPRFLSVTDSSTVSPGSGRPFPLPVTSVTECEKELSSGARRVMRNVSAKVCPSRSLSPRAKGISRWSASV